MGKVLVHRPCSSEVMRSFDQHGSRTEGLEDDHQVSEVELSFQVELNGDLLLPILSLPPFVLPLGSISRDNGLNPMVLELIIPVDGIGITQETLLPLSKSGKDTIPFLRSDPTR